MRFLYARVSSNDGSQKIDRQTTEIEKYDEVFEDYASGGSTNRPKLQEMLKWVRKGDIVEVHSIDRLARNINDLLQIVKTITEERHAEIYFIKENLRFTDDTNNPFNKLTLQIIGSIAEFERNMIKMIVSDVDGTLLSHGYINPKCIESIKKAQAKGIEFVVASGRDYYGVTSVLDPLGIKCSAILGNGAQYCNKEGKAIMDCYLDKEMLKEILPVFIENNTPYMIFTTNGFYSTLKPDYVRDRFAYRGSVRFGNKMEDFLPGGPMSDSPACQIQQFDSIDEFIKKDLDIIKVEAFSHDEFEIQKVLPYFKDMKKIAYLSSYPDNVEITNENAQKGLILEKVIDLLNIKKEEVIVLGDGMNDITLFERFPYSFAPNNAEKVIQEKAYKVVSSCKDGAVSEAIEYALENL